MPVLNAAERAAKFVTVNCPYCQAPYKVDRDDAAAVVTDIKVRGYCENCQPAAADPMGQPVPAGNEANAISQLRGDHNKLSAQVRAMDQTLKSLLAAVKDIAGSVRPDIVVNDQAQPTDQK